MMVCHIAMYSAFQRHGCGAGSMCPISTPHPIHEDGSRPAGSAQPPRAAPRRAPQARCWSPGRRPYRVEYAGEPRSLSSGSDGAGAAPAAAANGGVGGRSAGTPGGAVGLNGLNTPAAASGGSAKLSALVTVEPAPGAAIGPRRRRRYSSSCSCGLCVEIGVACARRSDSPPLAPGTGLRALAALHGCVRPDDAHFAAGPCQRNWCAPALGAQRCAQPLPTSPAG